MLAWLVPIGSIEKKKEKKNPKECKIVYMKKALNTYLNKKGNFL